eukprot:7376648-Prymnesium_polylepis.2
MERQATGWRERAAHRHEDEGEQVVAKGAREPCQHAEARHGECDSGGGEREEGAARIASHLAAPRAEGGGREQSPLEGIGHCELTHGRAHTGGEVEVDGRPHVEEVVGCSDEEVGG